jgi:hypothetical protein
MSRGELRGVAAVFSLVLAWLCVGTDARADIASAEALFRVGGELLNGGKVAEACLKFAESQRQDPSPGTLLNLAACHAKQGKAASAWAEYLAAKRAAQTAGRTDLAEEGQRQADQIAPQRSFLTLVVDKPVDGLKLTRNGDALDTGSFGARLPTDPGRYTVTASAPGRKAWSGEVTVEGGGDDKQLHIPELGLAPEKSEVGVGNGAKAAPAATTRPSKLPYVIGGIGLAVTAVGFTFGGLASSRYSAAKDACPTLKNCSPSAIDDRNTAGAFANLANVGVGVGLATVVTGVVLLLTQHSSPSSSEQPRAGALTFVPLLEPGRASATLRGGF